MAAGLAQGLDKALLIARTEQVRVLREATRSGYQQMGVKRYRRLCAKSDRTCLACLALDGKIYATNTIMDSHPGCRCFMTAVIPGDTDDRAGAQAPYGSASRWFAGLDEKRQAEILGRGHFELYQKGVPLAEMAQVRNDPVWGPTLGVKPLGQIDLDWSRQYKGKLTEEFVQRNAMRRKTRAQLQSERLVELQSTAIDPLMAKIRSSTYLPKPGYHFNKHGQGMGYQTEKDYLKGFRQFIKRDDLKVFSSIDEKSGDRFWHLVDRNNGFVAQYNESAGKQWSFYRANDIGRYMGARRSWFVEVKQNGDNWEFERW